MKKPKRNKPTRAEVDTTVAGLESALLTGEFPPYVDDWFKYQRDVIQACALSADFPDDVDYETARHIEAVFDSQQRSAVKVWNSLATDELKVDFLTAMCHAAIFATGAGQLDNYSANKNRRAAGKDVGSENEGTHRYPKAHALAMKLFRDIAATDKRSLTLKAQAITNVIIETYARQKIKEPIPSPKTVYKWLKKDSR